MPKILVVDDEMPIRLLLRTAIASPDFVVLEADCGRRALEIAAREAPLALVVTDVLMPGIDGFELAQQLMHAGQAANFLFMSGYCETHDMLKRLDEFPSAAFLGKPFSIAEFLQVMRKLVAPEASSPMSAHRRPA